jgi:hypothetical protein
VLARTLQSLRSSRLGSRRGGAKSALQIVAWWEARRVVFNACVGSAGVVSLVLLIAMALLSERLIGDSFVLPDPPGFMVIGIALYAIAANVAYTGGWVAELFVRRAWPTEAPSLATAAFSAGMVASVLLTLLIGFVFSLAIVVHLAFALISRPAN